MNETSPDAELTKPSSPDEVKTPSDSAESADLREDTVLKEETISSEERDGVDPSQTETPDENDIKDGEEAPAEVEVPPKPKVQGPRSMRGLKIGKVVVNITQGQSGEPLDRAMTILESLTGQRPSTRRAKQTIRTWGIRRNEPIACMVTMRGEKAEDFLRKVFPAVGNRINPRSFDRNGNFAFGIREHIDIPGQRYDPSLGIVGMDVMATVERPGYRVSRRRRARSRVGQSHRVIREESIEFIKQSFGVEVGLPSE